MAKGKYKIVITGADGFIGRNLSLKASQVYNPKEILYLVHNKKNKSKIKNIFKNIKGSIRGVDLLYKNSLKGLPKSPKTIIHLAASTETSEKDHRVNFPGTKNLIDAFSPMGKDTHVIYTSSTAIYAGRKNCFKPIDELTEPVPSNEYGRTKLKAENWLTRKCIDKGFRLTILRISTVFGREPRENGVFDSIKKSAARPLISCWSRLNWPGLTSLIYIGDVANAIIKIAKNPPKPGGPEVYVVYSQSLTLYQISEIMHEAMDINYKEVKLPTHFWRVVAGLRHLIPRLENLLSPSFYNLFWRGSIIVDDSLHCESDKFFKRFPEWKPKRFEDKVDEVVG